ncbi:MAG: inositol monophosphatase [Candidatus Saccharibacteria bacterium]|nr:inositol monophosphatase [Candidatus Saccharibacteria bacterium]
MHEYTQYLGFAKSMAARASKIMQKYYDRSDITSYKDDESIVTIADQAINKDLINQVRRAFPGHAVDGEEEQFGKGKSRFVWVCDPIDGTFMYAHHIPVATFSLALVIDGAPTIGVIYEPFADNLYYAVKDKGAYLREHAFLQEINPRPKDKKLSVNDYRLDSRGSEGDFYMWPSAEYNLWPALEELGHKSYFGSIGGAVRACACVAGGDFNAVIFPGTKHKNCDVAAAKVIVEEAGGKVTDLFGHEQRYDRDIKGALITNGVVHDEILKVLAKHISSPKK